MQKTESRILLCYMVFLKNWSRPDNQIFGNNYSMECQTRSLRRVHRLI